MVILQDLARFWQKFLQDDVSSCKILPDSGKILQDNHSNPAWGDKCSQHSRIQQKFTKTHYHSRIREHLTENISFAFWTSFDLPALIDLLIGRWIFSNWNKKAHKRFKNENTITILMLTNFKTLDETKSGFAITVQLIKKPNCSLSNALFCKRQSCSI